MEKTTNIVVQLTTRDRLLELGKMHDSFDNVIARLIEENKKLRIELELMLLDGAV